MVKYPTISVIMSVYNGERYVHKSIESILNQSFSNFEFIIINDGSTDCTQKILENYQRKDTRIVIHKQNNTGLTPALNKAIKLSCGIYIARQDADDVSLSPRLEKQYNIMEKHQDLVLCGSNCINIYSNGIRNEWGWNDEKTLEKTAYYKTPFAHSTAFIRKSVLEKSGTYNEKFKTSQDVELWMRLKKFGRITMLKTPLIERYILHSSISFKHRWRQFYDATRARFYYAPKHKKIATILYSTASFGLQFIPVNLYLLFKPNAKVQ
jgi:glycosyltransferase involved in cell wall biosynthesis